MYLQGTPEEVGAIEEVLKMGGVPSALVLAFWSWLRNEIRFVNLRLDWHDSRLAALEEVNGITAPAPPVSKRLRRRMIPNGIDARQS